jgi:hypothetical protein
MPEYEKQRIQAETKPKNKEGAFMSHLATTYEAIILSTVLPTDVEVGVLMYDGFMFYGDKPEGLLEQLFDHPCKSAWRVRTGGEDGLVDHSGRLHRDPRGSTECG